MMRKLPLNYNHPMSKQLLEVRCHKILDNPDTMFKVMAINNVFQNIKYISHESFKPDGPSSLDLYKICPF